MATAPSLQAQGNIAAVTTGDLAITLPAYAANDIVVITTVGWVPNTTTGTNTQSLSSPWTKYSPDITTITSSIIDAEYTFWWARATSASSLGTTVTITRPTGWDTGNDTCWAGRAYVVRGCQTTGDPFDQLTASTISTAANPALPAVTVSGNTRSVIAFYCSTDNNTAPTAASGYTVGTAATTTTGTDAGFQTYLDPTSTSVSAVTPTGGTAPAQGGSVYFSASFIPSSVQVTATGTGSAFTHAYFPTRTGGASLVATNPHYGQGVKPKYSGTLDNVQFTLAKSNAPTGDVVVQVYSAGTGTFGSTQIPGTLLATSDAIDASTFTINPTYTYTTFKFSGANRISLTAGTAYYFVVYHATAAASTNLVNVGYVRGLGPGMDLEGTAVYSGSSGASWFTDTSPDTDTLIKVEVANTTTTVIGPNRRTATGSGTGTQSADAANRTVRVTYTYVPKSDSQDGNWTNSAGNNTNLYSYVDESYASPDGAFIRGATDTTDVSTTGMLYLGLGTLVAGAGSSDGYDYRPSSGRIRFRVRATNRVDDTVQLQYGIVATVGATNRTFGDSLTTSSTLTVTSNTYVDTGWLNWPFTRTGIEAFANTNMILALRQVVTPVSTADATYLEIDAIEVELTFSKIKRGIPLTYGHGYAAGMPVAGTTSYAGVAYNSVSTFYRGQTFKSPYGGRLMKMRFDVNKVGSPAGSVYAELWSAGTGTYGTDLLPGTLLATSDAVDASTLPTSTETYTTFTFSGASQYVVTADTAYVAVLKAVTTTADPSNYLRYNGIFASTSTNRLHPGNAVSKTGAGAWTSLGSPTKFTVSVSSATGAKKAIRTATGSGTGTQSATGNRRRARTATGTGLGTQSANIKYSRIASGSGTGTQTATRLRRVPRSVTNTGLGTATSSGRQPKKYYLLT